MKKIDNNLVDQLLNINVDTDFRFSDLAFFAFKNNLIVKLEKEEDILDCSELFAIDKVINNNHGQMFVYGFNADITPTISVGITRARRKVDILLNYNIGQSSTAEEILVYIKKYIGDSNAILLEAKAGKNINLAFIKEYKNINNIVINRELCLLRIVLNDTLLINAVGLEFSEIAYSKVYNELLDSELIINAIKHEEYLKLNYSAGMAHIYTDTLNKYYNVNVEAGETILDKAKDTPNLNYKINKQLAICDTFTDNALKMQQFKNSWNNHISISDYNRTLEFALGKAFEVTLEKYPIAVSLFLLSNIDKTTMNLVREAASNTVVKTEEDIIKMYDNALDISIIMSKDILAAVIDGEKLDVSFNIEQASSMLYLFNTEKDFMQSFKDVVVKPIMDNVIADILEQKSKQPELDNNPINWRQE